ncbi:hypothetical protein [Desulfovibrio sp. JC022]|uniref:hypothetical protein n=1 Tax=Desulfovibrio sp. JC022 TaxID=2593642 RepID=UPI0013D76A8C|nr:hypothetical protein [Desulfovibrio sp. JC022]NDV24037.1 hypothetical protein [Desulfovibrio sp. JC022]
MNDNWEPPWNWGVFKRKQCKRDYICSELGANHRMVCIYDTLLKKGFSETYWQYVYPEQIGGLIKTFCKGSLELHVRFFRNDKIYAEIEIGRCAYIHFSKHRYYANNYLKLLMKSQGVNVLEYLDSAIAKYKISGKKAPEWSAKNKFCTTKVKKLIKTAMIFGDWKTLSFLLLLTVSVMPQTNSVFLSVATFILIVAHIFAPKKS